MDILYLLIPMSVVLVAVIAVIFLWAVKSGQFEDMEGPAHRILMDDDDMPDTGPDEPPRSRDKSIDINQADK